MANVVVTMTGDEQRLFKSLAKIIAQEAKMGEGFDNAKKKSKGFEESVIGSLKSMAMGYASVTTATTLFNKLLSEQKRLADDAANANRNLGRAQQEAIKNLAGLTSKEKKRALAQAGPIQQATGFPDQAALTSAIGAGFSASGDIQRTLSAVQAAAQLTRLTPEQIESVTAGALDVARGSGISDAQRNIGFLLSAGGLSRIEDPEKLSRNLAPVVSSGVETVPAQNRQEAARQAAALFGALTAGGTDVTGESSGTAAITMLGKMQQFFSKRKDDPGTISGRIAAMRGDEKLRREFLGPKGFAEQRFRGPMEQILTPGSALGASMDQATAQIQFDANIFRQHVDEIANLTPQLKNAMAQAASEGAIQGAQLDPQLGKKGTISKILSETLSNVQAAPFESLANLATMGEYHVRTLFGADPAKTAIDALEMQRRSLELAGSTEGVKIINSQIEAIKGLQRSLDANTAATNGNTKASAGPVRTPPKPSNRAGQLSEMHSQRE